MWGRCARSCVPDYNTAPTTTAILSDAILENDGPVPEGPSGWSTPEKRLMEAVLIDGIHWAVEGDPKDQAWVLSTRTDSPTAFNSLCDLFELDPDTIRRVMQARWQAGGKVQRQHRTTVGKPAGMRITEGTKGQKR